MIGAIIVMVIGAMAGQTALAQQGTISAQPQIIVSGSAEITASRRAREQVSTDVIPSQIKVTARIDARWKFVPASTAK
jgi:hypothetical protein